MDRFSDRYADLIIRSALKLEKGDVLSINTEEENSEFAHLIAEKAKKITGNGSFIQYIENGKITETEEASTDFPIEGKATVLLHLPRYKSYEDAEEGKILSAREIQMYRHLADPLDNGVPVVPYASAPIPTKQWAEILEENGDEALPYSLISSLLSLEEDEAERMIKDKEDVIEYEKAELNKLELVSCHCYSEDGTDISFSFLPSSVFASTVATTKKGRRFLPSLYASDIFRAIETKSFNGYMTATRSFMLFGKIVKSMNIEYRNGKIETYSTDEESGRLFSIYLAQDEKAAEPSELSIAEEHGQASEIPLFALPEWDRMRTTSITLGSPRPETLIDIEDKGEHSLLYLSIPIGSDSLTIDAYDKDGNEYTILEDGYIGEE